MKLSGRQQWTLLILGVVAFFGLIVGWNVLQWHMESATYNRLTGAHTTWWDAVWVELRVMDSPKSNG